MGASKFSTIKWISVGVIIGIIIFLLVVLVIFPEDRKETTEEGPRKIEKEKVEKKVLKFERQLTQQQIAKLQRERQEAEERWMEAEIKLAIEKLFRIGHLLQDYYNEIRKLKDLGENWWLYDYQTQVEFAAFLARHGAGKGYWPEYETRYHSLSGGRYSYEDALEILDNILFPPYAAGVDLAQDSDFEKINKILNFFNSHIRYEHDFNDLLRAPAETIGFKSGDCDDYSILISAALTRIEIKSAIIFVKNVDETKAHAMVLFQSEEIFPGLYYYSDLTDYGLPSGEWYILEPQFTFEEHQQRPEWFEQWVLEAVALVESPY